MSTPETGESRIDVAVVGGSIAGCATAIRFSQMGYQVGVIDKKAMTDDSYKQLCTHFVQPHAVPVLAGLGLAHLHGPDSAVPTKAVFVTAGGVIEAPGGYLADRPDSYALNLERRVLDPALRAAARQQGVQYFDGTGVEAIEGDGDGWVLDTRTRTGPHRFRARLVVAADGRRSRLARLLDNQADSRPNERAVLFGVFTGVKAPRENSSVFIMNGRDFACLYPLVDGRTKLVLFAERSRFDGWGGGDERLRHFLHYFDELPDAPAMSDAVPEGPLYGYDDYPNLIRRPVARSVPFVGDAAMSLDPMSGVGCGFALASADLLASSFAGRSWDGDDVAAGLDEYRRRYEESILPHAEGICGDSLLDKNETTRRRIFETISGDPELTAKYLALTGRVLSPNEFQRALMRALMTRRPAAPTKRDN